MKSAARYALATRLLRDCYNAIGIQLLCDCYVIAIRLLRDWHTIAYAIAILNAIRLLFDAPWDCFAIVNVMRLSCDCYGDCYAIAI